MSDVVQKPIIFLAFANDHQDYLYKLTEEQDGIRTALESAEANNLCEVVYETDTNIDKIFKIFDKYQDRIAIFHYGGHAEDYTLLLKEADGKRQHAHSEGLVSFLAQQKGLQLVFINGCCSKQQAEKLRREGIPAVVGTSQPIDDAAATLLSVQFYESLAAGRNIDQAWKTAEAKVKTKTDATSGYRAIGSLIEKAAEARISFPWELYICPGAEVVTEWNLPRSSRNPLFGLPLPEHYYRNLPPAPFLGLHYFQKQDAAIFFGRGGQIRELYNHINGVHPIILFYGKSGVGKSSLLYAGLLPRIEDKFSVIYVRRDQESGLTGTLDEALGEETEIKVETAEKESNRQKNLQLLSEFKQQLDDDSLKKELQTLIESFTSEPPTEIPDHLPTILKKWQAIEARDRKPLIVILDQVEEKFTRPMADNGEAEDELIRFLKTIRPLFTAAANMIRGKLILSFRKEYHPEIRDAFQSLALPYAEVFLKRLDRVGIMEAADGITRDPNLQRKYRLVVESSTENNLPAILADDLLADRESPIAPVLQIILKKLWEMAKAKDENAPRLSVDRYLQLKKDGITMGEFFEQQMARLAQKMPREVESGLALDLLNAHTTPLGTAGRCRREDLDVSYPDRRDVINQLLQECVDFSLLMKIGKEATILSHDTLAPVVKNDFNTSDKAGQRAARILTNKVRDFRESPNDIFLEKEDLSIVEEGAFGMRKLNNLEDQLLEASRKVRMQRQRQVRRVKMALVGLLLGIIGFAGFAYLQKQTAEMEALRSKSQFLTIKASEVARKDNTAALRIMQSAYGLVAEDPPVPVLQMTSRIFENRTRDAFYSKKFQHDDYLTSAQFVLDGKKILTVSRNPVSYFAGDVLLWDIDTGDTTLIYRDGGNVHKPVISPDGRKVLLNSKNIAAYMFDLETGDSLNAFGSNPDSLRAAAFSPDGQIVATREGEALYLWSLMGESLAVVQHSGYILQAIFSADSKTILTASRDSTARLTSINGDTLAVIRHSSSMDAAIFSPDGQYILTGASGCGQKDCDGSVRLSTIKGDSLASFDYPSYLLEMKFTPDGNTIVISWKDQTLHSWDPLSGKVLEHKREAVDNRLGMQFSPDGKKTLLGAGNRVEIAHWPFFILRPKVIEHKRIVSFAEFSKDGRKVLTAANDSTAKLWDAGTGALLTTFRHDDRKICNVSFSPDGKFVLTGSDDATARLWPIDGFSINSILKERVGLGQFSPTDNLMLFSGPDSAVELREGLHGNERFNLQEPQTSREQISGYFSPDGSKILTMSLDETVRFKTVRLWDTVTGDSLGVFQHPRIAVGAVLSPDGSKLRTVTGDTARVWDTATGTLLHILGFEGGVDFEMRSHDWRKIIIRDGDMVGVWNVTSGKQLAEFPHDHGPDWARLSPDGNKVVTQYAYSAFLWTIGDTSAMVLKHGDSVNSSVFSPDGQKVLTASDDNTARLWSLSGDALAVYSHDDEDEVRTAVFSNDGRQVLTGGNDKIARLWSLEGELLASYQHKKNVFQATFSNDDRQILTLSERRIDDSFGDARLWLTPKGVYEWLKTTPVYQLSEAEKKEYGIID